jgi:transposase-like protein
MSKLTVEERRRRRFSERFRKEQVGYIERGEKTISQVSKQYQVKTASVAGWINKYGKAKQPPTILIQTGEDVQLIQSMEKEIQTLKRIIGEQQVKTLYLEECLALAKEKLGSDFEKKIKSKW